ncbi:hypothetical protein ACLB2K_017348 [Fragaria x ananassa]
MLTLAADLDPDISGDEMQDEVKGLDSSTKGFGYGLEFYMDLALKLALFRSSQANVGTAAQYRPPYLPTSCFGSDASQFPSSNLFGSAGEGIWDNGAACGRQYLVSCISAAVPKTCIPGKTIQIKIVDRALSSVSRPSRNDATMVLSTTAFAAIANSSASFVNVEFQQ